jgi:hypothetical protein
MKEIQFSNILLRYKEYSIYLFEIENFFQSLHSMGIPHSTLSNMNSTFSIIRHDVRVPVDKFTPRGNINWRIPSLTSSTPSTRVSPHNIRYSPLDPNYHNPFSLGAALIQKQPSRSTALKGYKIVKTTPGMDSLCMGSLRSII